MGPYNVLAVAVALPLAPTASYDEDSPPGTGLDIVDYDGVAMFTLNAALGSGTLPTLDVVIEHSTDGDDGIVHAEAIAGVHQEETYSLAHADVSDVVVTDGESTTYDVDDDYTVDAEAGTITIVDAGAIADDSDIVVSYKWAGTFTAVTGGAFAQVTKVAGAGLQALTLDVSNLRRYVRLRPTIAGTTPDFMFGAEFIGFKKSS